MRAVHLRLICLIGLMALFAGCPATHGTARLEPSGGADDFDKQAAVLKDLGQFDKALEKLQSQFADPPDASNAALGQADVQFGLTTRVEASRAGIVLTDRYNHSEYVLWGFELDPKDVGKDTLKTTADTSEGGGLRLELQARHGSLGVKLLARWVDARFLQVSREVTLSGIDMTYNLPASGHRWQLDGPWLPYRLVPGEQGPYGVVPDAQVDGNWQTATYPYTSMVPAIAAFNKTHGFLLASTDKAAKDLTRVYDLQWRVDPHYNTGSQIALTYRYFDGVKDIFTDPYVVSGLAQRDSIVLEPLTITAESSDKTQVEAQSRAVIAALGELSRCFWFVPKPPPPVQPGSALALQEWIAQPDELADLQRQAMGKWEAQLNEGLLPDGRLGVTGAPGIGAKDLGGMGLAKQGVEVLNQLNTAGLPTLQYTDLLHLTTASPYLKSADTWLEHGPDKKPIALDDQHSNQLVIDLRLPAAAAWDVRKLVDDLKATPDVRGYAFGSLDYAQPPCVSPAGDARVESYPGAAAFTLLQAATALRTARPDIVLSAAGGLNLAQPACCNVYANGDGAFGSGFGSGAAGTSEPALPLSNRLSNDVCQQVFGVNPWLTFGGNSLSAQVLATTPNVGGHAILRSYNDQAGFTAFAENMTALRQAGGEVQVLYAEPEKSKYAMERERPAVYDKLIAVQPANLEDAQSVWLSFHGIGGSVNVDKYNRLTVEWQGGQWTEQLPGGIWKIEYSDPTAVKPDDTVLVKQEPLQFTPLPGSSSG